MKLNKMICKLSSLDVFRIYIKDEKGEMIYHGKITEKVMETYGRKKLIAWQPGIGDFLVWLKGVNNE